MIPSSPARTSREPIALPAHLRRIVLAGFMGAGKSSVGRLLAERLRWSFLDLDAHLEARAGMTIPQIFRDHGEAEFRRLESSALASALSSANTVLALGGGVPESITNRLLLEQTPGTYTVFLDAPFATLYDRCMLEGVGNPSAVRPVLHDPAEAELRFQRRHPLYVRMAQLRLDTATLSAEDAAEAIVAALKQANI